MSWQDRLQPEIRFLSPDGDSFIAQWSGDPRKMEKKLGIFEFPNLVGAVVQDLQVGASLSTLSFSFEGADHDLEADRFYESAKQRGTWTIEHPTKGQFVWQLMTISEDTQPVNSANLTAFKTEWIEPIGDVPAVSTSQVAAGVRNQSTIVQAKANEQADASAKIDTPSAITRFKTGVRAAANTVKTALAPLTATVAEINAQVESIDRAITDSLSSTVFSVVSLAGQIQTMIMLPSQIEGDLTTLLGYYGELLESAVTLTDAEQDETTINDAVIREIVAVTSLAAIAEIAVNSPPTTRNQAISALTDIAASFSAILAGLDGSQTSLGGAYISQSESFNDTSLLLAGTSDLLLKRSFDLATAKMISLNRHRTPVEVAMTEGVDIDEFIATNNLKGDDILLLPPGRVVVVYS